MRATTVMAVGCAALLAAGCNAIFGVGDLRVDGSGGAAAGGGGGGAGGSGGGGGGACGEGDARSCYDGPDGTEGVGTCQAGVQQCTDGAWGACVGQTLPQPPDCSQPEDIDCDGMACGELLWTRSYGSSGQELVTDLAVVADGSLALSGMFGGAMAVGPIQLNTNSRDGVVAWIAPDGTAQQAEVFAAGFGDATASAVSAAPDGGVVVCGAFEGQLQLPGGMTVNGSFNSWDSYVVKLDPMGQVQWAEHISGNGSQFCNEVLALPDGGAVVYGRYQGELLIGNEAQNSNSWDLFVARFGSNGQLDWLEDFGSGAEERARGAALVSDGVVISGSHSNNFVAAGVAIPHGSGYDGFVLKLDMAGNGVWGRAFEGPQTDRVLALAAGPGDELVLTGYFEVTVNIGGINLDTPNQIDSDDLWVARLAADGAVLWANRYGDDSDQRGMAVAVAPSGDAYVAGWFEGSLDLGDAVHSDSGGGRDAFLLRLDAAGATVFSRSFPITAAPQANGFIHVDERSLTIDPQGFVLFSASYGGDIGNPPLHSALGNGDIFVAKLSP